MAPLKLMTTASPILKIVSMTHPITSPYGSMVISSNFVQVPMTRMVGSEVTLE
jgi:hypothetical protein